MTIKALIISSEITKGMKSLGSRSMLNINKTNKIIDQQISSIRSMYRNTQITIAAGFEYEKVKQYINHRYKNIELIHNQDYASSNEVGNIKLFLDSSVEDMDYLFVMNGGVLLKNKSISFNKIKGSSKIFLMRSIKNNFSLGCSKKDTIEYIFYDLEIPWCECVLLNRKSIDNLRDFLNDNSIKNMYTFELLNHIFHKDSMEPIYINKNHIMKITNSSELIKAKNFLT